MKKLKFVAALLLLAGIITLNSCKKEVAPTDNVANAAALSSITSDEAVGGGTTWGADIAGSTDVQTTVCNKLGVKYIREAIEVKNFNGNVTWLKNLTQKGFKVVLNLKWESGKGSKPVPFPTASDMTKYKQQLTKIFNAFKPEIAVIENEPTTDLFHSGPIENYINELKNAVSVCKQFNVKVTDGAIHVPYINSVKNGNANSGKALEVKKLITAFKTIGLNYVNIHTAGPTGKDPNIYTPGILKSAADYVRSQTGKPVMSNEFNVKNYSSTLVRNMVNEFKKADFTIAMIRSGYSSSGAVPINKGTNLLANGVAYASAIK